jgi:hypothetical protein
VAGLLDVVINTGDLPSAAGVAEGYDLSRVIGQWQSIANGRFRNDCRALKQMIRETDELRLWEKNVGGSTYNDRDDFLRRKVLIDYELTERDFTEIVEALYRDPGKAEAVLRKHGRPKKGEGKGATGTFKRGTNSRVYTLARLDRDRPDLASRVRGAELSVNAAALEAGWRKVPSALDQLRKAWGKATPDERRTFLEEAS